MQVVFRSDLSLRDFRGDLFCDLRLRRRHYGGAREEHRLRTGNYIQPHTADFSAQTLGHYDRKLFSLCHQTLKTERRNSETTTKDEAVLMYLTALISDSLLYNYVHIMEQHFRPCAYCNSALCGYNGGPVSWCFLLLWRSAVKPGHRKSK